MRIDRDAIARHGLGVVEVADALETAMVGKAVSRVLEGRNAFDLVVRFDDAVRSTPEAVGDIPVDTPSGAKVPLRSLARIVRERGPNQVSRENVQRKFVVMANVAGPDLSGVVEEIRARVDAARAVPEGYHVEYGGQFESAASAGRTLAVLGVAVVLGIFLLLYVALGTARDPVLVMANLPLALVGGVAGVRLTGGTISIAEVIGFITLFGIATRNGLMLVSHVKHIREVEGEPDFRAAVERGALERLAPILMTALAAGLALIPLALGGGEPGNEIQGPMAVVILAGLLSSTLLNMVVVPALYLRFGPREPAGPEAAEVERGLSRATPRPGGAGLGALLLAGSLALGAAGCAGGERRGEDAAGGATSPQTTTRAPDPAPGGHAAWLHDRRSEPRAEDGAGGEARLPDGPLDEDRAVALALRLRPELAALAAERDAAAGRAEQAGTLPNPRLVLSSEVNTFDDPFDSGEHVAGIALPIAIGGRLGAGERAAERERERREAVLEAESRDVALGVRIAFADALTADLEARAARESALAAAQAASVTARRFAAGGARENDALRAEVEATRAEVEADSARVEAAKARATLAAAIGVPEARLATLAGEPRVPTSVALTGGEGLAARLEGHPRLRAADAAVAAAAAEVERLRAERVPDLTIGAYYRRIEHDREDGFDVGASMDIPIFGRNQGAIAEAEHRVRAAEAARRAEAAHLRLSLESARQDLARAVGRLRSLDATLVPKAARSLEIAERAYASGATQILDVLEARRTLADARLARLAALREGARARARVLSLTGDAP